MFKGVYHLLVIETPVVTALIALRFWNAAMYELWDVSFTPLLKVSQALSESSTFNSPLPMNARPLDKVRLSVGILVKHCLKILYHVLYLLYITSPHTVCVSMFTD